MYGSNHLKRRRTDVWRRRTAETTWICLFCEVTIKFSKVCTLREETKQHWMFAVCEWIPWLQGTSLHSAESFWRWNWGQGSLVLKGEQYGVLSKRVEIFLEASCPWIRQKWLLIVRRFSAGLSPKVVLLKDEERPLCEALHSLLHWKTWRGRRKSDHLWGPTAIRCCLSVDFVRIAKSFCSRWDVYSADKSSIWAGSCCRPDQNAHHRQIEKANFIFCDFGAWQKNQTRSLQRWSQLFIQSSMIWSVPHWGITL